MVEEVSGAHRWRAADHGELLSFWSACPFPRLLALKIRTVIAPGRIFCEVAGTTQKVGFLKARLKSRPCPGLSPSRPPSPPWHLQQLAMPRPCLPCCCTRRRVRTEPSTRGMHRLDHCSAPGPSAASGRRCGRQWTALPASAAPSSAKGKWTKP